MKMKIKSQAEKIWPPDDFLHTKLRGDPVLLDPVEHQVIPIGSVQLPDLLPQCFNLSEKEI